MKRKKPNRYERRQIQEQRVKESLSGSGVYIYENNSDGDLSLPKPTQSGVRSVGPRKRFQGDSYYMRWVGPPLNLLRLIEEVLPQTKETDNKEKEMSEKKLILDQPDIINNQGKVEHVLVDQTPQQALNDSTDANEKKPEVLLNESPVDGVEIILG